MAVRSRTSTAKPSSRRDYATRSVGWLRQRYEADRILEGNTVVIARPRGSTPPSP
jgi:hypothetical protein